MAKRRKSPAKTTGRTWLIRAGIGIAIGVVAGFGLGALAVRVLQPPGVIPKDTSSAEGERKPRGGTAAATDEPATSSEPENARPKDGTLVPEVVGLAEGDARNLVTRAGFSVGSVTLKASNEPIGTVVAAFPVPGEAILLPATVNLILSDGKGKPDSTAVPPQLNN